MKNLVVALFLIVTPALFAQTVPEIPFDSVPSFLKLPPDMHLGEVTGIAVNSKGRVIVFNRGNTTGPAYGATAAQLLEFGADGKYIREIGRNLYAWSSSTRPTALRRTGRGISMLPIAGITASRYSIRMGNSCVR